MKIKRLKTQTNLVKKVPIADSSQIFRIDRGKESSQSSTTSSKPKEVRIEFNNSQMKDADLSKYGSTALKLQVGSLRNLVYAHFWIESTKTQQRVDAVGNKRGLADVDGGRALQWNGATTIASRVAQKLRGRNCNLKLK